MEILVAIALGLVLGGVVVFTLTLASRWYDGKDSGRNGYSYHNDSKYTLYSYAFDRGYTAGQVARVRKDSDADRAARNKERYGRND